MQRNTKQLLELLEQQKIIFDDLIALAQEQIEALKTNDLPELSRITSRQEEKGRQMAILERRKNEILLSYSETVYNLQDLLQFMFPEERCRVETVLRELQDLHKKWKRSHQLNMLLLRQGLKHTEKILSFIGSSENNTYSSGGKMQKKLTQVFINQNI
ncbi:MAG: flagellar protein FlgN [Syntrophomonadaceae bacterium]|jgi:flagellar biosynthesis/type III secretory pathway chaperone